MNLLRKKKQQEFNAKKSNVRSIGKKNLTNNEPRLNPFNLEKIAKTIEHEPALIRIGKNGVTENIIEETKRLLSLKKAVKIKILPNSPIEDTKSFFEELEKTIGYKLWRVKGNTGIFIYKKVSH